MKAQEGKFDMPDKYFEMTSSELKDFIKKILVVFN